MEVIPKHSWRSLIGVTSLPSIVALLFCFSVPESPRFLCSQGRFNEAVRVLNMGANMNQRVLPEGELVTRLVKSMKIEEEKLNKKFVDLKEEYEMFCNNEAELEKEIKLLVEQKEGKEKELDQHILHDKTELESSKLQGDNEIVKLNAQLTFLKDKEVKENQADTMVDSQAQPINNDEAEFQKEIEALVEQKKRKEDRLVSLMEEKNRPQQFWKMRGRS
ncbi:organic cation/carnitine transporter 7-like protein [Tanacetum coccineum]